MTPPPDIDGRLRQLRSILPAVPLTRVLAWIESAPPGVRRERPSPIQRRSRSTWPWPHNNRQN